jgi:uncharacterized OB-fold protein
MEVARYWRTNIQRYKLTGTMCARCGRKHFSARPVCDECQDANQSQNISVRIEHNPTAEPAQR